MTEKNSFCSPLSSVFQSVFKACVHSRGLEHRSTRKSRFLLPSGAPIWHHCPSRNALIIHCTVHLSVPYDPDPNSHCFWAPQSSPRSDHPHLLTGDSSIRKAASGHGCGPARRSKGPSVPLSPGPGHHLLHYHRILPRH